MPAAAQNVESVLSPGPLSQAHAKWDDDCKQCHVKFDRAAQDRLCMDCHSHQDIAQDVRQKTGFHGRLKPQACRACHSEHKGRNAKLVPMDQLDKNRFDHTQTDYPLLGGHIKVACEKCHDPKKKFSQAPQDCNACHAKDDVHKGSLGPKCADCHVEESWKKVKFDHDKTRFPLVGKHNDVKCADCHKDTNYRETPHACIACHKKDDKHKGHFSEKCEPCHTAKSWKTIVFNHDTDTKYPLLGKHRTVKCEACHTTPLHGVKVSNVCIDCHKKDDKHKGTLGTDCVKCHSERDWKEIGRFNHDKTDYPLRGKHVNVKCKDCHTTDVYKDAPKTCVGCHKKDDKHKGTLGDKCETCHNDRDWKKTSFDHNKTDFPLLGKHAKAECNACHKSTNYKEAPKDCYSCHKAEDKHEGQQGRACEKCHDERAWKPAPRFDHGLTRFPLLGKHVPVECKTCHTTGARYKDAKIDCVACHVKDDKHKKTLGPACELCHNARSWKAWDFDHDKRTKFPLDGKHKGLICSSCHKRPMEGKVLASTECVACHAKDDIHEGSYGRQCQQCHVTSSFKTIRQRGRPVSSVSSPAAEPGAVANRVASANRRFAS